MFTVLLWIPRRDPTSPSVGAGLRRAIYLFWLSYKSLLYSVFFTLYHGDLRRVHLLPLGPKRYSAGSRVLRDLYSPWWTARIQSQLLSISEHGVVCFCSRTQL